MANDFEPQSKSLVDWLSERTNRDGERVRRLEIARLGKVWIDPELMGSGYTFTSPWTHAGDPYKLFKYRLFDKDTLQVQGTVAGGTNGTKLTRLLPPFWPDLDIIIYGSVEVGATIEVAHLKVDHTNGDVYIYW